MVSRRALLGKIAAGLALLCVPGAARLSSAMGRVEGHGGTTADGAAITPGGGPQADTGSQQPPPPWELLKPLVVGSALRQGWQVADLTGVTEGSSVLTMLNEAGREQRIRICRNDGKPEGVVHTDRFDLLVVNGGEGNLATDEGVAQAAAQVAQVIASNEKDVEVSAMGLLPHSEWIRLSPASRRGNGR